MDAALRRDSTRVLLWANPHNPTGRCWTREDIRTLAKLCVECDVTLVSDEVWGEMVFDEAATPFTSALALLDDVPGLRERLIVLSSPSKTFNIAALDVAWAAVPHAPLRSRFLAVGKDQAEIPPFGYVAALAAYAEAESEAWRRRLITYVQANRDYALREIHDATGGRAVATRPESSYLMWVDVGDALPAGGLPVGGHATAAALFEAHGVGFSDGATFGSEPWYIRLNLGCRRETLELALARFRKALNAAK